MPKKIIIALFILLVSACSKPPETIKITGSTTVLPVIVQAAEYYKIKNKIKIIVNAGGSGVGINQLGLGKIDIGMASREITKDEIAQYPQTHFKRHVIGKDAVIPVVSAEIYAAGVTTLSLQQIKQIYQGKITNWQALGGPNRDILVIDKETSRGTRHVFMAAVFGDKKAKAAGADLILGSNNEEQTAITQSDSAIGMLSHAWLNKDVKGLSLKMDDNTIIEPTLDNIINGSFPITRDLLLLTNGIASKQVNEFIVFIRSEAGQKIVVKAGYVSIL